MLICFILGPPIIVKKYITNDYMTVLTAEFYSNPEPTCVQWYLSAELIINCTMAGYKVMQTNVNILMYQKNVHVEGYVTKLNITLPNLTNGKYTVVIANVFGKTNEEFEVNATGNSLKYLNLIYYFPFLTKTFDNFYVKQHFLHQAYLKQYSQVH